ncbi:FadR/GntR family transcriptional regulator [Novosphingobium sp. fls2-241-R2A-195]|jgi:GntR family transcriptional repressor for pyruvate dehydrogenase complex|uniref:FadR/GntR family transcriptional regulator n=1 Tax=Novosphingobium sp. fls2-241-R2A-195 TaxID=3040296 RepID=UPI002550C0CB|nr:FadR/GntR family transcriptional regulator [Novosphingobium sp. fls2-241-R2A-195]
MAERLKLYQRVAQEIEQGIRSGQYAAGSRLPAERDLAEQFQVSRPTIREAMIALEIRQLVEVRHGSGVYVAEEMPTDRTPAELNVGAFELIEARIMFEGEAAALAATVMSDEEVARVGEILERMEALDPATAEELALDRQFHMAIAEGTQSSLVAQTVEHLWDLREQSPLCRHMFEQARQVGINPRPDEHRRVYDALVERDSEQARSAMRAHLMRVSEDLLAVTELQLIEKAKQEIGEKRRRIARSPLAGVSH